MIKVCSTEKYPEAAIKKSFYGCNASRCDETGNPVESNVIL